MRQLKYLIKEAKQNTNTTDAEAISDALCVRLLNRAQEYIQAYLFTQNVESKLFRGQATFNMVSGVDTYQLPFNVYATNSINMVAYKHENKYSQIRQIAEKSRDMISGYFCSDNKIIFNPMPTQPHTIFLSYTKRLPSLGLSYGKIQTVNVGSIVLEAGFQDMTDIDDFFTVVDSTGKVIVYNLPVSQVGNTLTLASTTGILVGMFVVPGYYATTHCQLPNEFESSMIMALESMINARLSSTDLPMSKAFSDETLNQIGEMYAENTTDDFMPPIVEYSEWV